MGDTTRPRYAVPAGARSGGIHARTGDGRLAVVLCEAGISAGGHQHHHHPGHDNPAHHDGAHRDPNCPYAQSAGPAPLPTLPALEGGRVVFRPEAVTACSLLLKLFLTCGPTRQQTPRGPPSLA